LGGCWCGYSKNDEKNEKDAHQEPPLTQLGQDMH
jgi:hypothetical protein